MRSFSQTLTRHSLAQAGAQPDLPVVLLSQRTACRPLDAESIGERDQTRSLGWQGRQFVTICH